MRRQVTVDYANRIAFVVETGRHRSLVAPQPAKAGPGERSLQILDGSQVLPLGKQVEHDSHQSDGVHLDVVVAGKDIPKVGQITTMIIAFFLSEWKFLEPPESIGPGIFEQSIGEDVLRLRFDFLQTESNKVGTGLAEHE